MIRTLPAHTRQGPSLASASLLSELRRRYGVDAHDLWSEADEPRKTKILQKRLIELGAHPFSVYPKFAKYSRLASYCTPLSLLWQYKTQKERDILQTMIAYKKLPKGTPQWLTNSIFLLGGALGISISVYTLIALYGLSAFLITLFFPHSSFHIDSAEAIYLGIVGVAAGLVATLTSYLAVYMNGLKKQAIRMSRIVWAPALVTTVLVVSDSVMQSFLYPFNRIWVISALASFVFAGILPWMLLRTKAARKVHSR